MDSKQVSAAASQHRMAAVPESEHEELVSAPQPSTRMWNAPTPQLDDRTSSTSHFVRVMLRRSYRTCLAIAKLFSVRSIFSVEPRRLPGSDSVDRGSSVVTVERLYGERALYLVSLIRLAWLCATKSNIPNQFRRCRPIDS